MIMLFAAYSDVKVNKNPATDLWTMLKKNEPWCKKYWNWQHNTVEIVQCQNPPKFTELSNLFQMKIGHHMCQKINFLEKKGSWNETLESLVQKCKDVYESWKEECKLKGRRSWNNSLMLTNMSLVHITGMKALVTASV